MRAISQHAFGGPEVLGIAEVERPEPLPTEVLVRVRAVGINPVDTSIRSGAWPLLGNPPFVLGWDVSGVVEETGAGVTRFRPGDEVYGMPYFPRAVGAYAEYVVASSRQLAHKPARLDHTPLRRAAVGWSHRLAGARRRGSAGGGTTSADPRRRWRRRTPRGSNRQGAGCARDSDCQPLQTRLRPRARSRPAARLSSRGLREPSRRSRRRPGSGRRGLRRALAAHLARRGRPSDGCRSDESDTGRQGSRTPASASPESWSSPTMSHSSRSPAWWTQAASASTLNAPSPSTTSPRPIATSRAAT